MYCQVEYYYGMAPGGSCEKCLTPNCMYCHLDYSICHYCDTGYGKQVDGTCIPCTSSPSLCLTCDPYNVFTCYTCPNNMFLNSTFLVCQFCSVGC